MNASRRWIASACVVGAALLGTLAPMARAQQAEHVEATLGPVAENENRVEIRAARLAIEEDLIRRFRAAWSPEQAASVYPFSRFRAACESHLDPAKNLVPLPYKTWGECRTSATALGVRYLILIEISAGASAPEGTPLTFAYQLYRTNPGEIFESQRVAGNSADLPGALQSLASRIGLAIGYIKTPTFEAGIASMPTKRSDAFSAYWLGRGYLDLGEYDKALEQFAAAQQSDPEFPDPALWVGNVHLARATAAKTDGEWDAAIAAANQAVAVYEKLSSFGRLADALVLKSDTLAAQGKKPESWKACKTAALMRMQDGDIDTGYQLAEKVRGEMEQAGAAKDPDVYWLLGHAHCVRSGLTIDVGGGRDPIIADYKHGEEYLNQVLELDQKYVPALMDRGAMYLDYGRGYDPAGDEEQRVWRGNWLNWALSDFTDVTIYDPKNVDAFEQIGNCYAAMADFGPNPTEQNKKDLVSRTGQAVTSFIRALNILQETGQGESVRAGRLTLRLGSSYRRVERFDEAHQMLSQAKEILTDQDPDVWIELILLYIDDHDFDSARGAHSDAMAAVPFPPQRLRDMLARIDAAEKAWENTHEGFVPHRLDSGRRWQGGPAPR